MVELARASRSDTRGATVSSPSRSARRTALATSVSRLVTVRRTETPERWLMFEDWRASWLNVATTSSIHAGTVAATPSTSKGRASCWAMATSVATSSG